MKQEKNIKRNVPNLRFPKFDGEWEIRKVDKVLKRYINKVDVIADVEYRQIGIRSHGKGIFHKEKVTGEELGNKRVFWLKDNLFILNIVFAWEQAVAKTTGKEIGLIASHRFPMYDSINDSVDIDFITYFFKTKKGKFLLELASPGGAGRNKTLGQGEFENLDLDLPLIQEQQKIASLLSLLDDRISTQMKIIEDLKVLKSAIGERLFVDSQSDYKVVTLGDITENFSVRNKSNDSISVYSVTNDAGFIKQSEKFENREIAGEDTSTYKIIRQGEFAYNPARINVGSIARYNELSPCIISSLYVCFKPAKDVLSDWLLHLLKSKRIMYYYNVFGEGGVRLYLFYPNFSRIRIKLPSYNEQVKVANMISSIDSKLLLEISLLNSYTQQKQYLLSQMFI